MLRTELQNDPAGMGYDLGNLAQVEARINEPGARTRLVETWVSERGLLASYPGGPLEADALLTALENFAKTEAPLASIVRRAMKFLESPQGLDVATTVSRMLIAAVTDAGALTTDQRDKLLMMATRSCSRAEELGLGYVTDTMIREALQ